MAMVAADGPACPDSSLLLAAEDAVLTTRDAARVRHTSVPRPVLAGDLATLFAEDPAADGRARISARIQAGQRPHRRQALWWLGAAGLLSAAALAMVVLAPLRTVGSLAPPTVGQPEGGASTGAALPSVLVVDRPAIPPGEVELTVRGEASSPASLANPIAAALDLADSGNLPLAMSELEAIVRKNAASPSAGLALGAVQLRAAKNADAVATLETVRLLKTDAELKDETDWFLGIALVRTGNRDRARALLDGVCKKGGGRSARACAGVVEIDRLR
jgi:hypothetical protein